MNDKGIPYQAIDWGFGPEDGAQGRDGNVVLADRCSSPG